MYKTIRHGENSLQYTILPQNDDFRIEGKLGNSNRLAGNASSSMCSSSTSSTTTAASGSSSSACATSAAAAAGAAASSGHKRGSGPPRKRRTFFAYLGLIFVCTVIIGAVLIPFLVSAECLPSPTEWFLKTKAAFTHSGDRQLQQQQHIVAAVKSPTATTVVVAVPATSLSAAMLGQNVGKTVQIVNRNGVEQFVLKVNKTQPSSSSSTTTTTTSTTTTTTAAPTIVVVPATEPAAPAIMEVPVARSTPPPPVATVATYAPPLSNRLMPATITTRIIQVPLLKSMAKKPIMPPVLAKSNTQQQESSSNADASQNKSNSNNNNNWMNTHWAYIDPSTYVQWSVSITLIPESLLRMVTHSTLPLSLSYYRATRPRIACCCPPCLDLHLLA